MWLIYIATVGKRLKEFNLDFPWPVELRYIFWSDWIIHLVMAYMKGELKMVATVAVTFAKISVDIV